jgi:hypothetical protein
MKRNSPRRGQAAATTKTRAKPGTKRDGELADKTLNQVSGGLPAVQRNV